MDQQRIRPASSPVTKRFASGETTAADTATGPCAAGRRESSLKPLKARSSTEPSAKPTIMLPSKALATQWTRHEAWNKTKINLSKKRFAYYILPFWSWGGRSFLWWITKKTWDLSEFRKLETLQTQSWFGHAATNLGLVKWYIFQIVDVPAHQRITSCSYQNVVLNTKIARSLAYIMI